VVMIRSVLLRITTLMRTVRLRGLDTPYREGMETVSESSRASPAERQEKKRNQRLAGPVQ
jgi:hypothetical protein